MRISDWSSDVCSSDLRAQEALLIALTEWPASGVPDKPGAWLTAAAKRRLIDGVRHDAMRTRKEAEITRELDEEQDMRVEAALAALDDPLGDELLGLIFAARSEEHTSELQSLMRISYAVFCLKKKTNYYSSGYLP